MAKKFRVEMWHIIIAVIVIAVLFKQGYLTTFSTADIPTPTMSTWDSVKDKLTDGLTIGETKIQWWIIGLVLAALYMLFFRGMVGGPRYAGPIVGETRELRFASPTARR